MERTVLRSTGNAIAMSMLFALGSSTLARAATIDCETINSASAAGLMGVPKAKGLPVQPHQKLSPDNMDVLSCSYVEINLDPQARTMGYRVYTPIPKDLASVFESVAHPNIPGNPQKFSPGIGTGSTGWVRLSANGATYDGSIVFRGATNFVELNVSGMPSADAAKAALVKAGNVLAKSM